MDLNTAMTALNASMHALADLLEGPNQRKVRVAYHGMVDVDTATIEAAVQAGSAIGYDSVIALFDPADMAGGVRRIGIAMDEEDAVRLQFGRLWMGPACRRAVLVPRGGGEEWGHYMFEQGRFVHLHGWPAKDLARGTERAEARLAELTIKRALAA